MWQRQSRQQRGLRYGTNNEGTYILNVAIRTADHIIRSSATRTHCNLHCIASHRVTSCHIVCRVVVSSSRRPPTHAATMASAPPTGQVHGPSTSQQPVSGRPQVHHHQPGVGSGRTGRRSWGRRPPSIHMRCDVRGWNVRVIFISYHTITKFGPFLLNIILNSN